VRGLGRLLDLAEKVKKCVEGLERLSRDADETIADFILLNAALHMLQVSVQALIDMAYYYLSEKGIKPPNTYGEVALLLLKLEVLDEEEAKRLRSMIGFQNVLVHGYLSLDLELVRDILKRRAYREALKIAKKILKAAAEEDIDL